MTRAHVALDTAAIARFGERHPFRRLALFGSALRDDFHQGSDLDILVEFEPGARVTLFDMVDMERELSDIVGRRVDLRTPGDLSQYIRQRVLAEAETLYVHR
jgi:predicted nucleotidyltransferase